MGYNKCTVSLSLISKKMAISSYRRKIRSLYLFLFTFLKCLVHCKGLPPPTGVVAKPLLSWGPEVFSRVRLDASVSAAVYHERDTVVFFLAKIWNRAWKVSGTQGKPLLSRIAKHKSYKVVSANIRRKVSMSILSLFLEGYQFKNSSKNIIWKTFSAQYFPDVIKGGRRLPAASLAAWFLCTCVSIFWLLHQKAQSLLITPLGTFCL